MKLPDRIFGIGTEEAYKKYLEESKKDKEEPKTEETKQKTNLKLEDLTDFYRINNVDYRDGTYIVDLAKELLDNGSSKTQDEWIKYSRKAKEDNEFYVGDFPLYHALFTTLFKNKENSQYKKKVEEVREFLKNRFLKYWLMTLTRIRYTPSGKDIVIHNHSLRDKYEVQEGIVGPDGYVKDTSNKTLYKAILGIDNIAEIQAVYNWITGKDAYLWRVNNKPKSNDERVARFGAGSDWANFNCDGDPRNSDSALGVRAAKLK